jgi:type VI secretion system protein ImpB
LNDLLAKLDGNDDLDQLLGDVVANTERQSEVKEAVNGLPQESASEDETGTDGVDEPEEG